MENIESRMWVLLAKKLADEATPQEITELDKLLKDANLSVNNQELLKKLWERSLEGPSKFDTDIDKSWNNLAHLIFPETKNIEASPVVATIGDRPKKSRAWLYAAASIIILFTTVLGTIFYKSAHSKFSVINPAKLPNEVVSRNGAKTKITLPEGTTVWLNAGSKIHYGNDFTTKREVFLVGEAYFDVKHEASNPFVIHAANVNIKVLGTAFNVKAYADEDLVETVLIRGSVELTTNEDPDRKILLRPNEKISIVRSSLSTDEKTNPIHTESKKADLYHISKLEMSGDDNVLKDIAWMEDKLFFSGEDFKHLARRMERWYGVTIIFSSDKSAAIKFSGEFDNQNIVQALDALAFSCDNKFTYSINKNKIIIKPK